MDGFGKFTEKKGFFEAFGTTEGDEVVGSVAKKNAKNGGGLGVEAANDGALIKRRAGEVNLFPKACERGVGVEGGGGELDDSHLWRLTEGGG
jgi:hypothetical protein